jgi:UMF1 family MFS transporter
VLGCVATALLPLIAQGQYFIAGTLYAIAALGFSGNSMFSDALLVDVAEPKSYDRISAFGFAVGYIGGGLAFAFSAVMIAKHEAFGFATESDAMKQSFLLTAGWWLLFTIPALFWVRETPGVPNVGEGSVFTRGFRQFVATFKELRGDRRLLTFLGAYVLYIDALNTIIKMAADYGLGIGIGAGGIMMAILIIQFISFPAAVMFGRLAGKFGPKRCIQIGIVVYCGVCIYGPLINTTAEFFGLAVLIALVQGGVQSLSRSYFAALIPPEKGGEYFGFYNMLGKFAAVLGPTLMGAAALVVGNRYHIYSLLIMFAGGYVLLSKVRDEKPVNP